MAERLLAKGYELFLPTGPHAAEATAELLDRGARVLTDDAVVDVCGLCLPRPDDVAAVLRTGVCAQTRHVVDFTSGHPAAARSFAAELAVDGVDYIDAPVSGSSADASNGQLTIWVGAAAATYDEVVDRLMHDLGSRIHHMGSIGNGVAMKLVNQVTHLLTMAAVGEGVRLARALALDLDVAVASMTTSSASSAMMSRFGPSLVAGDFTPHFTLELARKDAIYALREARSADLAVPHLERLIHDMDQRCEAGLGAMHFTIAMVEPTMYGPAPSQP